MVGDLVDIRSSGALGSRYEAYKSAIAGARFDMEKKAWTASVENAMRIQARLRKEGFVPILTPAVTRRIEDEVAAAKKHLTKAARRVERLEAIIAEKGFSLYDFQRQDILWMSSRRRLINCNQQGTGKTLETLFTLPDASDGRVVVIGPSVAKAVWKKEAAKWRPDYRVRVLEGRGSFSWPEPGEIVVLNYDILPDAPPPVPKGPEDVFVICDEAHFLKGRYSTRHKRAKKLLDLASRAILLTGTPLPNRPEELWALMLLINVAHEAFGNLEQFVRCYNGKMKYAKVGGKNVYRGVDWGIPGPEAGERLKPVLVRHVKSEVLDLPEKIRRVVDVEITEEMRKTLDEEITLIDEKLQAPVIDETGQAHLFEGPKKSILTIKDIKDIPFTMLSRAMTVLAKCKTEAALEFVESFEQCEEPLLVFSAHREAIDKIASRPGWAAIVGGQKTHVRDAIEQDFQAGKYKGIAATIQASSTALTLHRASNELFIDLSWTPADNEQSEDRAHRIGQTKGLVITYLVVDHPLERHLWGLIAKKQGIILESIEKAREPKRIAPADLDALLPVPALEAIITKGPGARNKGARNKARKARTEAEKTAESFIRMAAAIEDDAERPLGLALTSSHAQIVEKYAILLMHRDGALEDREWQIALSIARYYAQRRKNVIFR